MVCPGTPDIQFPTQGVLFPHPVLQTRQKLQQLGVLQRSLIGMSFQGAVPDPRALLCSPHRLLLFGPSATLTPSAAQHQTPFPLPNSLLAFLLKCWFLLAPKTASPAGFHFSVWPPWFSLTAQKNLLQCLFHNCFFVVNESLNNFDCRVD